MRINEFIAQVENEGGHIIRGYRSPSELIGEMQKGLSTGKVVVFVPSTRSLRHFFNTDGFIRVASDIISRIRDADVILKPDLYEHRHAFALRPCGQKEYSPSAEPSKRPNSRKKPSRIVKGCGGQPGMNKSTGKSDAQPS